MLFSATQSSHSLWHQRQALLSQLHEISCQSVIESPEQRERLLTKFCQYLYGNLFDALNGGLIQEKDGKYYQPIIVNLYLSEIFTAADQVFYHGEFLQAAEKIIHSAMNDQLENSPINQSNLNCFFSKEELIKILDKDELRLLNALLEKSIEGSTVHTELNSQTIKQDGEMIIFKRSLKNAAKIAVMHFKEAQIVENSLITKLKAFNQTNLQKKNNLNSLTFFENCLVISSASQLLLSKPSSDVHNKISKLFFKLYQLVEIGKSNNLEKKPTDDTAVFRQNILELAYAGIIMLQVSFDQSVFNSVTNLISRLKLDIIKRPQPFDNNNRTQFLIEIVIQFSLNIRPALEHKNSQDNKVFEEYLASKTLSKNNIEMISLSKNNPESYLKINQLRANFIHNRLIFIL